MADPDSITVIITLALGVTSLFFGYSIFKIMLGLAGFYLGALFAQYFNAQFQVPDPVTLVSLIAMGVVGGLLAYFVYRFGLFLFGIFTGISISPVFIALVPMIPPFIVIILTGLAAVILIAKLERPLIIFFTVTAGASAVQSALAAWLWNTPLIWTQQTYQISPSRNLGQLVFWIFLVTVGLTVQLAWTARKE